MYLGRHGAGAVSRDEHEGGRGIDERIDDVWVKPGRGCTLRTTARGVANTPRAAPLHGMWWPSDHAGVAASLRCS